MDAYQERVIAEREELVDKLIKLSAFIEGPMWEHVDSAEQHRMIAQRLAMELYAHILDGRILSFGEEE